MVLSLISSTSFLQAALFPTIPFVSLTSAFSILCASLNAFLSILFLPNTFRKSPIVPIALEGP